MLDCVVVSIVRTQGTGNRDGTGRDRTGTYDDINNLEEKRVSDEVLGQHHSATNAGEVPHMFIWVVDVEAGDGDGDDVV